MLRHHYRLLNWEKTLTGDVVQTMWQCLHCKDTRLTVTPDDWGSECSGIDDERLDDLLKEAEEGYDPKDPKER